MTQELIKTDFNDAQLQIIKNTVAKDATGDEFKHFVSICRAKQLNPLENQIYFMKNKGKVSHITSIDGLRLIAQRSGQYEGQQGPFWCDADGKWVDVWLKDTPPVAAKVGVWRSGFREPTWAVAKFSEYAGGYMWKKMPGLMIAKCAEALALRKAFADSMSGLYTTEEMGQAEAVSRESKQQAKLKELKQPDEAPMTKAMGWIQKASDMHELKAIGVSIKSLGLSDAERGELRSKWNERAAEIEFTSEGHDPLTGEVVNG